MTDFNAPLSVDVVTPAAIERGEVIRSVIVT
jgi:hypothetical protein